MDAVEEPASGAKQKQYKEGKQGLQRPPQPLHAALLVLCGERLPAAPVDLNPREDGDEYTCFIQSKVDGVRVLRQGPQTNELITRH